MNSLTRSGGPIGAARCGRMLLAAALVLASSLFAPPGAATEQQWDRSDRQWGENLRDIERRRVKALVEGDMEIARRLHADDFQLVNPSGGALTKDDYLGALSSGFIDYLVWQPGEIEVRRNGNTAVLRYQSQLQIVIAGATQPLNRFWHTDYYEKRRGQWQVVWSQATQILN